MSMEIIIRDYRPEDASRVVEVYRDSYNTLRKSKGGMHPDGGVENWLKKSDKDILDIITRGNVVTVAEAKETGEITGIITMSNGLISRCLNSTFCRTLYVKEKFQRGKAGVIVGAKLRRANLNKAKSMGFRKIYGYANPESKSFYEKCGAKYLPAYNIKSLNNIVELNYYESELRPSIWNSFRIEPHILKLIKQLPDNIRTFLSSKLRV